MGGVLAALQDAGEPAHVRNDFRQAYLADAGASSWDRASRFERFVSERYGRTGVPAPRQVVRRPTFDGFFAAPDGGGLADRTQRRFFSDGTVPDDVAVDEATTPREVVEAARASLAYPAPDVGRLDLRAAAGEPRYVTHRGPAGAGLRMVPGPGPLLPGRAGVQRRRPRAAAGGGGLRRRPGRAPAARQPDPDRPDGGQVAVALEGVSGGKADGKLQLLREDGGGRPAA